MIWVGNSGLEDETRGALFEGAGVLFALPTECACEIARDPSISLWDD